VTMPSRGNTLQLKPSASWNLPHSPSALARPNMPGVSRETLPRDGMKPGGVQVRFPEMILQPDSSPISQDQLAAEVKGIYAGLVMVEAKCINIDAAQAHDLDSQLGAEQWQALIALHRTLLYEHHDFLMATQHPSATPALRGLAVKYSMPARMWKHGIHAFLEVLRHRRPDSQDYMLSFIYLAYQMMALLYETVPSFLDTWIECLGDLARYRMAIEEEKEAHAQWGGVAARWYTMAADRHPAVGRLNHHLGILERPSLRKLFFYSKALTCVIPFPNAKDSLATLCGPIVQDEQAIKNSSQSAEASTVTFHAMVIAEQDEANIGLMSSTALRLLVQLPRPKLREIGVTLAIVNVAGRLGLGASTNKLWQRYTNALDRSQPSSNAVSAGLPKCEPLPDKDGCAVRDSMTDVRTDFYFQCFNGVVRSYGAKGDIWDLLPFVHVMLVHLHSLQSLQSREGAHDTYTHGGSLMDTAKLSWGGLSDYLNSLIQHEPLNARVLDSARQGVFPAPSERKEAARPLPEDHMIRGLVWGQWYFPSDWFVGHAADDDSRAIETAGMKRDRVERVQWLGCYFAFHTDFLSLDMEKGSFDAPIRGPGVPLVAFVGETTSESEGFSCATTLADTTSEHETVSSATTLSASSEDDGFTIVKSPKAKTSSKKQTPKHTGAQPPPPRTYAAAVAAAAAAAPRKVKQNHHNNTDVRVVDEDSMDLEAA